MPFKRTEDNNEAQKESYRFEIRIKLVKQKAEIQDTKFKSKFRKIRRYC